MKSLICLLLILNNFTHANTYLFDQELRSSPKVSLLQQSFSSPNSNQAELHIVNGNGENLFQQNCQGPFKEVLFCKLENLKNLILVKINRAEKIEIRLNNQLVVSTNTNLPKELGSLKILVPVLSQNQIRILVKGLPTAKIKVPINSPAAVNLAPISRFSFQGENGVAPETIQFSGLLSSDDSQINSYEWDFGNGQTAVGALVSATYLQGATYQVSLKVTDDQGLANISVQSISIIQNQAPTARIRFLSASTGTAPFSTWLDGSQSSDPDGQQLQYFWDFGDGTTSIEIKPIRQYLAAGQYTISLKVQDPYLSESIVTAQVNVQVQNLPPDPTTIAPPLAEEKPATPIEKYGFLFLSTNPIQVDVNQESFEEDRILAASGIVLDENLQPMSGVKVRILNHPEFGYTLTRADGKWDMAFNGGGLLVFDFQKNGFGAVQRKLQTENFISLVIDDVILTAKDTIKTLVKLNENTQGAIHISSEKSDADGARRSALFLPPNTSANLLRPDGTTVDVDQLTFRITEFTVDENGEQKMPALLPGRTAYTWAADFSADEADLLGATKIQFNQPVPIYVDNFLNIPTGIAVPIGYLNPQTGNWEGLRDGIVIKALAIDANNRLELDLGKGVAATAEELAVHFITNQELEKLKDIYTVGQTFWRGTVTHFSTIDLNFNFAQNKEPSVPNPNTDKPPQDCQGNTNCRGCQAGSVINSDRRLIVEDIQLPGTDMSLFWSSEKAPGRLAAGEVFIKPFNENILNSNTGRLLRARIGVQIAGKSFYQTYTNPDINQVFRYNWDGLDQFGRKVYESVPANLTLEYFYPDSRYFLSRFDNDRSSTFDTFNPEIQVVTFPARNAFLIRRNTKVVITSPFDQYRKISQKQFGSWSLSHHHTYDPIKRVLYRGDCGTQDANQAISTVKPFVGTGFGGTTGDGGPAFNASVSLPRKVVKSSRGHYYIAELGGARIRKIDGKTGIISTYAGTGTPGYSGDGGPAINAQISTIASIQVAEDETLYFTENARHVIRKITPDGIISTIAGTAGVEGFTGNGGPATQALIRSPRGLVLGEDGSLYISEERNHSIRRIWPDGKIDLFAGNGTQGFSGDGDTALNAQFNFPNYTAMDKQGNMYVADSGNHRVRKISRTGFVETIAGNGQPGFFGDNGPAVDSIISIPSDIAVNDQGEIFFSDRGNARIRAIDSTGQIRTVVGNGNTGFNGNGLAGLDTELNDIRDLYLDTDGSLIFSEFSGNRIRRLSNNTQSSSLLGNEITSGDGSEIYIFNSQNQHTQTLYGKTRQLKYQFRYGANNFLTEVEDSFGKITRFNRTGTGDIQQIITPNGQVYNLSADQSYLTSLTTPENQTYQMIYDNRGFITKLTKPKGNSKYFEFEEQGYLSKLSDDFGSIKNIVSDNITGVFYTTAENLTRYYDRFNNISTGNYLNTTEPHGGLTQTVYFGQEFTTTLNYNGILTQNISKPDTRLSGFTRFDQLTVDTYPDELGFSSSSERRSFTYNPSGYIETIDKNNHGRFFTRETYDSTTRIKRTSTQGGRLQFSLTNDKEQIIGSQQGSLTPIEYSYDSLGRLTRMTQGTRITQMSYDSYGFLSQITDPENQTTRFENDRVGRSLKQIRNDGLSIDFGFDQNNNSTSVTPPGKLLHDMAFNLADLMSVYRGPASTPQTTEYDLDKRLKKQIRGDNRSLDYIYFGVGNKNGLLQQIQTPDFSIEYDYNTQTKNLVSATGTDGVTNNYTITGDKLISKLYTGSINAQVSYQYQSTGMLVGQEIIQNQSLTMDYEVDGFLSQAGNLNMTYNAPNGQLVTKQLGNIREEISYNNFGEMIRRQFFFQTTSVADYLYSRDQLGRITEIIYNTSAGSSRLNYTYDNINRLKTYSVDGVLSRTYNYDGNGNITQIQTPSGQTTATYNDQDQLLTFGPLQQDYNSHGELASRLNTDTGVATTYQYTSMGQLRSVTSVGNTISYTFDGENKRVGRRLNSAVTNLWVYDAQGRLVAELNPDNSLKSRFVYGSQSHSPDYMIQGSTQYFFFKDHLGSILSVVNIATGSTAQNLRYNDRGQVLSDTNSGFQPFGFAGGQYDYQTGLVRFGARDYDSVTGRWTAKDPILFQGGQENLYVYVNNDPVNFVDPEGMARIGDSRSPFASGGGYVGSGGGGGPSRSNGGTIYVSPSGVAVQASPGSTVSVSNNNAGLRIQAPNSQGGANTIRIMDPTKNYPNGYIRNQNSGGQYTDVNGNVVPKNDPRGHICK